MSENSSNDTPSSTIVNPSHSSQIGPTNTNKSSTSAIMALVLGILSLLCCGFFTGLPAFFVGRSAMKEHNPNESNHTIAKIGMILGLIGSILSALGAIFYAVFFAIGITASMFQPGF